MKKRTPVSRIMTADPISVNSTHSLNDVVQIFETNNIHHVPVVSGEKLLGIISKTDIERISFVTDVNTKGTDTSKANTAVYDMLSLEQVMTSDLQTIKVDDQIRDAAELFTHGQYHALPVLDDSKLVGIVTTTDVIKYLLEQY